MDHGADDRLLSAGLFERGTERAMSNTLRRRQTGSVIGCVMVAIAAIGCDSFKASPMAPSAPLTTSPPAAAPVAVASTVPWHCFAQASSWKPADCGASASSLQLRSVAALVAPTAPSGLTSTVAGARVTLVWAAPGGGDAPASYVVEAGSSGGRADLANFDTGNSATALTVDSVPAGIYFVRVRARNSAGVSGPSADVVVTVAGAPGCAPNPPTSVAATVSGSSMNMQWAPPAGGCAATSYRIEAGSTPGAANLAVVDTANVATQFTASGV